MSRWLIRKHPEDLPSLRWRVSVPNVPTAYTGRSSWVDAMCLIAELEADLGDEVTA